MGAPARKPVPDSPAESRAPYFPIPIAQLESLTGLRVTLFLRMGDSYVEYAHSADSNRDLLFRHLREQKVTTVYVHLRERKEFFRETEKFLNEIIESENLTLEQKSHALQTAAVSLLEDLFQNPESTERLQDTKKLVENQISLIQKDPKAFLFLSKLGAHDYYTYTHSVGVAAFAISYLIAYGNYSKEELTLAGQGALLHDVGKARVPAEIINKTEALTEEEWARMKKHPEIGDALLRKAGFTSPIILSATRHHHENYDGSGYPDQLKGDDIHLVAQIVGFADVFNALTTNRSYSNARTSFETFQFIKEHLHGKFSTEIFKNFLLLFKE